jgi:hypothetical protein
MRLVASSNPDDVSRDQALRCRELLDSGGVFNGMRPLTAIALLSRWVKRTFPEIEPLGGLAVSYGLDDMVVPEGCEDMLREIQDGAEVCEAFDLLIYGDTCDVESDNEAIAKSLDAYWKAHAQIVHTPERWAVDLASLRTNASDRIT